jgi:hypothetical protein
MDWIGFGGEDGLDLEERRDWIGLGRENEWIGFGGED